MESRDRAMEGRVCLVTGATAGIGAVTARELADRGARVVIVGRNPDRCRSTVESIRGTTGSDSVEFLCADLSSQADVRRLAREFKEKHERLDVLVNNAGALFALRTESVDGIEMTLALNHLGYFLLTNLLLETLRASAPARIVNVSSEAHRDVKGFDFDDPQARRRGYGRSELASLAYSAAMPLVHPGFKRYAETKLANLLFTYELARRLAGTGVRANAVHPGFVASSFMAGNGSLGFFMRFWARFFAISAEEGARTLVLLAASPEVEEASGRYFVKQLPVQSSPASQDLNAAQRLWRLSEELTACEV